MSFQCQKFELNKEIGKKLLHTRICSYPEYAAKMYFFQYTKKSTILPIITNKQEIFDALSHFHKFSDADVGIANGIRQVYLDRFRNKLSFPWPARLQQPCEQARQKWVQDTVSMEKEAITPTSSVDSLVLYI